MAKLKRPQQSTGHGTGTKYEKTVSWPPPPGPGSLRGHTPGQSLVDSVRYERKAKEYYRRELEARVKQHEEEKARYYATLSRGFWAEVWFRLKTRWPWLTVFERKKKISPMPSGPDGGQHAALTTPTIKDEDESNQDAQPAA